MATRKYFSHNVTSNTNEQNLISDLVRETIQINGMDVNYVKRTESNPDSLFEDPERTSFNSSGTYTIEMYFTNTDGFSGEGDIITNFGYEVRDACTLVVAVDRFESVVGANSAPAIGDLVYIPMSNNLFEIHWVEDQVPFFQIGKNHTYQLECRLFRYRDQEMDTGIAAIDALETAQSYAIDLILASGGSGDYAVGDTVYQGSVGSETAKAEVASWTSGTRTLRVINITGEFTAAALSHNTANWTIQSLDAQTMPTDTFSRNLELESAETGIVDFTETNPFGIF